jgi:hypothetical protein
MNARTVPCIIVTAMFLVTAGFPGSARCEHQLGGGLHYLRTLGEIEENPEWNPDALGFLVSYRYKLTLVKLEADLEWVPDYGGSDKTLFQPQAWFIAGGLIYGAGGIGGSYIDGGWFDNPFYGLRAGADLTLAGFNLDLFATYRWQSSTVFDDINEEDLDALTFGAIFRFVF